MAKLTKGYVLFVSSLLALAGCMKDDQAKEPAYGQSSLPPEAENTTGNEYSSARAEPMESPGRELQEPVSDSESAKMATPARGAEQTQALSDGQILNVLGIVDSGEIDQAKLAQQRSKNSRVKDFAGKMIEHHSESKDKAEELAEEANLSREDSAPAGELRTGAKQVMQTLLAEQQGAVFDRLYVDSQVDQHAKVLDLIEQRLIPSASNDKLRNQLVETRTMVTNHLSDARELQNEISTTRRGE
jgi:putative membrane protein